MSVLFSFVLVQKIQKNCNTFNTTLQFKYEKFQKNILKRGKLLNEIVLLSYDKA